ncbi:cytosolic endo-beta-N-acetylglucosaminidase isoform X2 [Boleophthalmus pectinirostris]|uniref:cytosolic endo-beta-N-acetylglucosaminidase isoform X2 n=1 Tax=Boleophthalmus pectinirostris TaxID=150288 RepID=UPI00243289DF|nr:cytosolic endo-beta-N-acetylglucosaminidase isoform X2 [Boleophthalmus pectinirostris]
MLRPGHHGAHHRGSAHAGGAAVLEEERGPPLQRVHCPPVPPRPAPVPLPCEDSDLPRHDGRVLGRQGTDSAQPYSFYHWHHIDIFNYFTHNMVTIPPAGWTNAGHRHGVLVLGTFITEWTDGAKVCEDFLKDEESYRAVADKLVQICHCYGFDGWLINIENELSASAVETMPLFLRYLTEQIHERVSGGLVLWYDSVVQTGKLQWQNELNQNNRQFFEVCDGFFTNYNWNEQNLEWMKGYSAVQGREADVYIGVDVFARGDVVGGMYETNKPLEMIRKHNFSAAVFAPGWVYETQEKTEFRHNQDKFWALLSDLLPLHRPVHSLPFTSTFCQGFGKSLYWRGKIERERPWFDLSAQQIQPELCSSKEGRGWLKSRACPEHVWSGGSSLLLEGLIPAEHTGAVAARVLSLHVPLASSTLLCVVYKASPGVSVSLESTVHHPDEDTVTSVSPVRLEEGHDVVSRYTRLCGLHNEKDWTVMCVLLEAQRGSLRDVSVNISRDAEDQDTAFSLRLGQITLLDASTLQLPSERIEGLCIYDVVWLHGSSSTNSHPPEVLLNATLRWHFKPELACHYRVHWRRLRGPDPRVAGGPLVFLSRAQSHLFRITELAVPAPPGLLEVLVEPVLKSGFVLPESQWGRARLSYSQDQ